MNELELDRIARARSLDACRSIALQAPAGSGKTTVLTQRLLALLAVVDQPEAILAVTFTRKAAAEMRSRVISALTMVATRDRAEWEATANQVELITLNLACQALERSRQRDWRVIENPGRLRIQTIDGLNHRLAMSMPVSARGLAGLRLADSLTPLYREAARQCLIDAETDPQYAAASQLVFSRFNNDWTRLESLLSDMLATRATWQQAVAGHDDQELFRSMESTLNRARQQAIESLQANLSQTLIKEGLELARYAADTLGSPAVPGLDPDDFGNLQTLATFALRKEDTPTLRKKIDKRQGFPTDQPAMKARAVEWLDTLSELDVVESLNEIRLLPAAHKEGWDEPTFAALAQLLRLSLAELQVLFTERGVVDHTAMATTALTACEASDLLAEERIEHILIDEFQDTSIDQLSLLRALTLDWRPGDGRSLFLVGDPMQSIYQFRDADVGLFGYTQRYGVGRVQLESLRLTQNFRSIDPVVDSINTTFSQIFPKTEDSTRAAVRYVPCVAGRSDSVETSLSGWARGVHCHAVSSAPSEQAGAIGAEAARIVDIVTEVVRGDPSTRIAVLVPTRRHAPDIVSALRAAAIGVRGVDLVPLAETPVVLDLIALTRALHDPADRIAWLALLRGPACGLSLTDLTICLESLQSESDSSVIPECLIRLEGQTYEQGSPYSRLQRFWQAIAPALEEASPLAARVERTWLRLQGPWCYDAQSTITDARRYLDHLSMHERSGQWRGIGDFDWLLKGLYAASDVSAADGPSVEIMTIHRAKGLEFDCVILPCLAQSTRQDEPELLNLLRWIDSEGQEAWVMSPMRSSAERTNEPILEWIKHRHQQRSAHERVRVLYVAATRAKRALHYVATLEVDQEPRKGTALHTLWPSLECGFKESQSKNRKEYQEVNPQPAEQAFAKDAPSLGFDHSAPTPIPELQRLPLTISEYAWPDEVYSQSVTSQLSVVPDLSWTWVGDAARKAGTVVHRELERIVLSGSVPADVERYVGTHHTRWRAALHRAGVEAAQLASMTQRVSTAIKRCLEDEQGRWLLRRRERFDEVEFAVSGWVDGALVHGVLDRCFLDELGVRWIVYYKTTTHEGGDLDFFLSEQVRRYTPQLRRYRQLVAPLGPEPVRAGLYFPWLQRFIDLGEP